MQFVRSDLEFEMPVPEPSLSCKKSCTAGLRPACGNFSVWRSRISELLATTYKEDVPLPRTSAPQASTLRSYPTSLLSAHCCTSRHILTSCQPSVTCTLSSKVASPTTGNLSVLLRASRARSLRSSCSSATHSPHSSWRSTAVTPRELSPRVAIHLLSIEAYPMLQASGVKHHLQQPVHYRLLSRSRPLKNCTCCNSAALVQSSSYPILCPISPPRYDRLV
ncbi:hypothetical protein C8Q80DRAFT_115562 [Daedaleopsis nitida]|nr:hypothetical protein C8Q80DRAFT_115562 [Daedaleopsis nitida]